MILAIAGPVVHQIRIRAETVHEELVLRIGQRVEKALDGVRAAENHLSPAMLPLVSRTMPRLTGVRSALKCVTSTGLSSS